MCFFKRFHGCAAEAGADTMLDLPMWIPYLRNADSQACQNCHCFSHVVFHSHYDWLKSTFICKFLLTMDLVKGVTQFYSEQAKPPRYDLQELTGILVLSQVPQWCTTPISELRIQTFSSPWLSSSRPGTHLSGRSMEAAAMQWTRAVHIDLVHIFQSLPVYCNHLVSCGNTSDKASECHYNLFYQS